MQFDMHIYTTLPDIQFRSVTGHPRFEEIVLSAVTEFMSNDVIPNRIMVSHDEIRVFPENDDNWPSPGYISAPIELSQFAS